MKFSEVGFRAFYHNFIAIPLKENCREALKDFPGADRANYILTYGYINHTDGLTLEVLAAGFKHGEGFNFEDGNEEMSFKIRIGSIMDDECFYFDDKDGKLYNKYIDKMEMLKSYDVGDDIEETRNMDFLDELRQPEYPDDVMVFIVKDGNKMEGCWVRIEGLAEHHIIGTLLNEPDQDFCYHAGDRIKIFANQGDDEKIVLYSDMNESE